MAAMMPGVMPSGHLAFDLQSHIRTIPDFPKRGILFRDINPMLRSPEAVAEVVVACACGERDEDNGKAILVPSP